MPKFNAVVSNKATLIPTAPTALRKWLEKRKGLSVVMDIEDDKGRRTSQANRYYWGCVVETFQQVWSKPRIAIGLQPYTKEQVHRVLLQVLFGVEEGPLGTTVEIESHTMDTKTFNTLLIEKAKELAWQHYEMKIPDPDTWESSL